MEQRLHEEIYRTIPLVNALAPKVQRANAGVVEFLVPLSPNINDKGCAFGGSLASLLTLACWSVLRVQTWQQQIAAEIFVHTSKLVYRAPIWQDFLIRAEVDNSALQAFLAELASNNKAALHLRAQAFENDVANPEQVATSFEGRFVARVSPRL